ncbi:MAG: EAL domain-containing response regulator [Rhodospirillales bacterium]|jgi:EAL domain-containing protein (putative c-di-GMP-specific phosphodiesterase class I)/FixJ family two-component response regulator|nr:EAL domain-containing response regulator [Rhodospirillales bacterium]
MSSVEFNEMRVLVIDDHAFVRHTIGRMLSALGVREVVDSADGVEAMIRLKDDPDPFDVIFCDLQLPGRDGIEILRDLSQLGSSAGIVLISGEDESVLKAARNLATEQGLRVLGSLSKPIGADQVKAVMERVKEERSDTVHGPQLSIEADDLRRAIDQREIYPHFQPKVRLATHELESVEALARWNHPQHGHVSPGVFIPLAEEHGLIDALTNVMLEQAVKQCDEWRESGLNIQLAVNLSVDSLGRLDLPEYISGVAERFGIETSQMVLEVTESRISDNPTALLDITTRLRLKRFELSIDDFGTGYSSLQQLQRLPFTELKIDGAFVTGASQDATARSILESSIDLAQRLGMKIVVEGVETRADWDLVKSLGCDLAQGYFIARPMPGDELEAWLEAWERQVPPA